MWFETIHTRCPGGSQVRNMDSWFVKDLDSFIRASP
jgi:hypothetical protein